MRGERRRHRVQLANAQPAAARFGNERGAFDREAGLVAAAARRAQLADALDPGIVDSEFGRHVGHASGAGVAALLPNPGRMPGRSARGARIVEIVSLIAIAAIVAVGGKLVLANLAAHKAFAAIAILLLIGGAAVALRRTYRAPNDETRIVITKYVAYLVAAVLALWDVLAPAKWIPGSCIAAAEVALVFDMITIWARSNAAGGT